MIRNSDILSINYPTRNIKYTRKRTLSNTSNYFNEDNNYNGDISNDDSINDISSNDSISEVSNVDSLSEISHVELISEEHDYNGDISSNVSISEVSNVNNNINYNYELFNDNIEYVNKLSDLNIVDDYLDYEIINESKCVPIKNRYRKQTWYEYFRKIYMVTLILIMSIVIYFYYSYGKRKDNIVSKF